MKPLTFIAFISPATLFGIMVFSSYYLFGLGITIDVVLGSALLTLILMLVGLFFASIVWSNKEL